MTDLSAPDTKRLLLEAAEDCEELAEDYRRQSPNLGPTKEAKYRQAAVDGDGRATALRDLAAAFDGNPVNATLPSKDVAEVESLRTQIEILRRANCFLSEQLAHAPETRVADDADRYQWLKKTDPSQLAGICYRVPAACSHATDADIDEIVDLARGSPKKQGRPTSADVITQVCGVCRTVHSGPPCPPHKE